MVDIMASVDPQQTVTCSSATTSSPYRRVNSRATASRSGLAPHVTAYWLTSSSIAAMAAALTASGAGKSGNPCDRLTPPWRSLSRVISRMTDSVNCVAFWDPVSFDMLTGRYSRRTAINALGVYSRLCQAARRAFFFFVVGLAVVVFLGLDFGVEAAEGAFARASSATASDPSGLYKRR